MKKVSVVIPVYGVQQYIAATVQSVLDQTYQNLEVILVDDGSPDRSVEICKTFTDPRIRIIRQKNQGVSAARNTGIHNATGDYIAFLDGDDLWVPEKIAKHVEHLERSPEVGISFSYSAFINGEGEPLGIYQTAKTQDITPGYVLCRNPIGNGSTPVIRREVLAAIRHEEVGADGQVHPVYFDRTIHNMEDVECWLRMAALTHWKLEGIPEALTLYRIHANGHSAKIDKQVAALERVIEKVRGYAPEVIATHGNAARAYELRFLARRSVRSRDPETAVKMLHKALKAHWRIVLEEPRRSLMTCAAVYALCLIPTSFYARLEDAAIKAVGASQKRRIEQESAEAA